MHTPFPPSPSPQPQGRITMRLAAVCAAAPSRRASTPPRSMLPRRNARNNERVQRLEAASVEVRVFAAVAFKGFSLQALCACCVHDAVRAFHRPMLKNNTLHAHATKQGADDDGCGELDAPDENRWSRLWKDFKSEVRIVLCVCRCLCSRAHVLASASAVLKRKKNHPRPRQRIPLPQNKGPQRRPRSASRGP
jgi:hypothetical protein